MDQNYYVQQMILQRMIQRISTGLAILLLLGVLFLWVHSRFRKSRSRIAALAAGLLLLGSMGVQQAEAAPDPGLLVTGGQRAEAEEWYLPGVRIRALMKTAGERLLAERMYGSSLELLELSADAEGTAEEQLQETGAVWMTILEEKRSPDDSRELELELSEEGIYHIKRVSVKDRVSEGDPETSDPEAVTEEVTEEEILTIIIGDNSSEQETQKEREEETDEPEENHPGEELPAEERPEKPRDPVQQGPGQDAGGNEEKPAAADPAPEDRTAPGIRITGVENAAVYGSPVIPHIHIEDSSISFPSLKYSLTGARTGQLDLQALADVRKSRNGLDIRVDGFRSAEDDVYTLSVQAADLAGNVSREEVVFSLDQEGSAFILSDATKELVEKYYTEEPEDVVLSEVNTGGVIYELALSRDGALRELKEDQDYSVEVRGGDGDWKIYTYRIFADTFREDGVYHLDITSRDQADNVNNNQIRDARIDFVVDKSGAGISEGKKTGNRDEKDPEDPASLKEQGNQNDLGEEQTASQEAQAFADHSVTETQGKDGKREEKNPVALILLLIGSLITMGAGLYLVRKKERWLH